MTRTGPVLVVVATSGRALARSAARAHRRVVVLDAFADLDTRQFGRTVPVAAAHGMALDPERILRALAAESARNTCEILIGSGFEHMPGLPTELARYGRVYANEPDVVGALKDPDIGSGLLRATGWKVAETRRDPPASAQTEGWLEKRIGAAGGAHVRRWAGQERSADAYYQRAVRGDAQSVTFLADGARARVLGFNRLRTEPVGEAPFCYAGAIRLDEVPEALRRQAQARLDRLVRVTGLRGLAGLDFVRTSEGMVALEVNPRPTASFELYDEDVTDGLVSWHLRSFAGPLSGTGPVLGAQARVSRGCAVLYARAPLVVPPAVEYPAWCRDLPVAGTRIPAGAPVLSVFAEAAGARGVERLLDARASSMQHVTQRWAARSLEAA